MEVGPNFNTRNFISNIRSINTSNISSRVTLGAWVGEGTTGLRRRWRGSTTRMGLWDRRAIRTLCLNPVLDLELGQG